MRMTSRNIGQPPAMAILCHHSSEPTIRERLTMLLCRVKSVFGFCEEVGDLLSEELGAGPPERPVCLVRSPAAPAPNLPDPGNVQPCQPSPSRSTPAQPAPEDGPPDRPGSSGYGAATEPLSPPSAFPAPAPNSSLSRSPTSSQNPKTLLTRHKSIVRHGLAKKNDAEVTNGRGCRNMQNSA